MKQKISALTTLDVLSGVAMPTFPAAGETAPPMGGRYTEIMSIPVIDPAIEEIAGAFRWKGET
jgi:hypothetical protein